LDKQEVIGDFVTRMITTNSDGTQSVLETTNSAIEGVALDTATQIYGSTPPDDTFLLADIDRETLVFIASCYFEA
jgi:hypothetical protein